MGNYHRSVPAGTVGESSLNVAHYRALAERERSLAVRRAFAGLANGLGRMFTGKRRERPA